MINKKLLLLSTVFVPRYAQSMESNIDLLLASNVKTMRAAAANVDIRLDKILARKILIIGPDLLTPVAALEAMDKARYDASLKEWINMLDPGGTKLGGFTPEEYAKFKKVVKFRVWRDDSFSGLTEVTTDDYLTDTDEKTKRRCIAYLVAGSLAQNAFIQYHMGSRLGDASETAQVQLVLGVHAAAEKIESELLAMFGLEAPAPMNDATLITKAKHMLEELSQQASSSW